MLGRPGGRARIEMQRQRFGELDAIVTGGTDGAGGGDGPVVVLAHGFAVAGDDLVGLAGFLEVPPATRFVFPTGPITVPIGPTARGWWQVDLVKLEQSLATGTPRDLSGDVPEGLPAARAQLSTLLSEVQRQLAVPPERIVIGGFSQGGILSLDVALHSDAAYAGVVVLSGTLVAEAEWTRALAGRPAGVAFLAHGSGDTVFATTSAARVRDLLVGAGWRVEWQEFAGSHEVALPVIRRLGPWLARVLGGAAGG